MTRNNFLSILFTGILFLFLAVFFFSNGKENTEPIPRISAKQAKVLMEKEKSCILLDVRTEKEFLKRHIKGAILIPHFEIQQRAASELPDRDSCVMVYCRSGRRSAIAARRLFQLGYSRVYDLGAISSWPYATVP